MLSSINNSADDLETILTEDKYLRLVTCKICKGDIKRSIAVQEMMLGTNHIFMYSECAKCGCLQISDIPTDISRYYTSDYYSYKLSPKRLLKRLRRGLRRRLILTIPNSLEWLISSLPDKDPLFHIYRKLGITLDSDVLDVGAGAGTHVLEMREAGIKGSVGLDPFLPDDQLWEGELLVKKATLDQYDGSFDLITFHHSLEHMAEQAKVLARAKQLLKPGGKILVRIPTVSSEAFERYQEHWFQIDAPRHYYLHSHQSIKLVATEAGLSVSSLWCDSSPKQFILSEQYRNEISLFDKRSFINKNSKMFSKHQLNNFYKMTSELNSQLRGDQICVVLTVQ
jgi:SAM-dependent methyltransferase